MQMASSSPAFLIFFYIQLVFNLCDADDNFQLTFNGTITNGESLVSPNQRFELGFFSPTDSNNNKSYLAIWYKNFPHIVPWIANPENPITTSLATLTISRNGNLILLNSTNNVVWSSNHSSSSTSTVSPQNLELQLLDSGNLVLREIEEEEEEKFLWQSFDYPRDTLLPGMKIGWDWTTGRSWNLTSWTDLTDPSPGNFVYGMDLLGLPQLVLREGSRKLFRNGVWNGVRFSGIYKSLPDNPVFNYKYANNSEEIYFFYEFKNDSPITRLVLNESGILQRYAIREGRSDWDLVYSSPSDLCDEYGKCGVNGVCKLNSDQSCACLKGFVPKSETEWNVLDRSSGCVRKTPLDCEKGDGFLKVKNVKLPDLLEYKFWMNDGMNLKECEEQCFRNCSCTGYANSNITGKGSGCLIWFGDLIDIKEVVVAKGSEQNMFIRVAASELVHNGKKRIVVMITVIAAVLGMLFFSLLIWFRYQKLKRKEKEKDDIELPLFDLATLTTATNNFSSSNMIGAGGFGSVYMGKLSTGQEIAVKRLSKESGQGVQEFKNEIILISKLQHRNLVRILGCCPDGKEKLLVYEYMPNQSLDNFLFDWKRTLLNWQHRFDIAMGIAKGLAYLHHDSRLRIIHRDLKASNVLLDSELKPKISDFGIARIFGGDQNEASTKTVIGTYGYMSPEYIIDGKFSTKSDVFSFGVLLLEIVSGKKNTKYLGADEYYNISGHAWLLWKEGKSIEIMDKCLENSYVKSQVERCVQISLLCVQRYPKDRPTMSSVVSMLGNEDVVLAEPKQPGFFIEQCLVPTQTVTTECTCGNHVTVTVLDPR